jgi:hypothetical protein
MSMGLIAPADFLRQMADPSDGCGRDLFIDEYLETERIGQRIQLANRRAQRHLTVGIVIFSGPDQFLGRQPEVHPDQDPRAAAPKLSQPLVRDEMILHDRHKKDRTPGLS